MPYVRGVNIAGAEFGEIPGVYGRDYTYNSERTFRYFSSRGLNVFRVCVRWERLQPALGGPLDGEHIGYLKQNIEWARAYGGHVILNVHNFARYRGAIVSSDELADLWARLAAEFRDEDGVWAYGLMNEPHDMGAADWKSMSQAAVMAIRGAEDGKRILVPGDHWSSAYRWAETHGPSGWIADPADNFLYEAHVYFDSDRSGRYRATYDEELSRNPALASIGVARLEPFVRWCEANGVRGFLGEYGVPGSDERWLAVLDTFLTALDGAGLGGTYWAAGEWWGDYALSVQPAADFEEDRPQMVVLERHLGTESAL